MLLLQNNSLGIPHALHPSVSLGARALVKNMDYFWTYYLKGDHCSRGLWQGMNYQYICISTQLLKCAIPRHAKR